MNASPLRKEMEDLVWKVTDENYKRVSSGLRQLFYGGAWIPISELPERALEERVRTAKAHRDVSTSGNKYITEQHVTHRNVAGLLHTRKVTLYAVGTSPYPSFLNGEKASKFLVSVREYAQHKNAIYLWFVPKGKKNVRELISTAGRHYGRVYLVVMDGWDHPSFSTSTPLPGRTPGVEVSAGRRTHEITDDINAYVDSHRSKILVDLRGHNVIEKELY